MNEHLKHTDFMFHWGSFKNFTMSKEDVFVIDIEEISIHVYVNDESHHDILHCVSLYLNEFTKKITGDLHMKIKGDMMLKISLDNPLNHLSTVDLKFWFLIEKTHETKVYIDDVNGIHYDSHLYIRQLSFINQLIFI